MILKSDLDLHRSLPAAPDAVATAVADELRRNGCAVRSVAPGVIEFDGPPMYRGLAAGEWQPASLVSSGTVWLNPAAADGYMRLTLRISPALMILAAAAACGVVMLDVFVGTRFVILFVLAWIVWTILVSARDAFETWVNHGARQVLPPGSVP
ncbi:MAG TPA: hypothetical protein VFS20_32670 [Longimicrobium sp.]|nr:hypothetical protein [Longimicrobium sp.]